MFVSGKSPHLSDQHPWVMSCSDFMYYFPLCLLPICSRSHLHRAFGALSDFHGPSHVNSKNSSVLESFVFTEFKVPFFFWWKFFSWQLRPYYKLGLAAFDAKDLMFHGSRLLIESSISGWIFPVNVSTLFSLTQHLSIFQHLHPFIYHLSS